MTQDEIIRMAREAGFSINDGIVMGGASDLERFAAIVAAHEREKLKVPIECQTEVEKTAFAFGWFKAIERIEAAVLAEREACAKVCETDELCCKCGDECAAAIRSRSSKH